MTLPVESAIPRIVAALGSTGTAVVVAPPGSGKTTIVPLRMLTHVTGRIVVLEPRRLATRAAARRMAQLLGEEVGETVGYVTRHDRATGPGTRIEVVTEGVLTRRLQRDPGLEGTGLVVFDEFHERNLQTDLGLALALDARSVLRPDLSLVVMSATLDGHRVADALGPGTQVISTDARVHPVDLRWRPAARKARLEDHTATVIQEALRAEIGDVLVFLPGMREIDRVARRLEETGAPCEIHRLHGALSIADQDAAVTPSPRRKVVLATDIAETSLTVEGVRIVVDSGLARAPRFDPRTGMTRLATISISRASAEQRAGRAGRTEPGVAYRLWSKVEHGSRRPFIEPEISQVDLAGLSLELAMWGVADPADLVFLDKPPVKALNEARKLLVDLGALTPEASTITETGRAMANLPVHPRLARMIVDAGADSWLACIIAALLEERDIVRGGDDLAPVDVAFRVEVLEGTARHQSVDRAAVDRVRRSARDLARRAGVDQDGCDVERVGPTLALAFPDRLALRRGSPGRFQLRIGTTAWMSSADPLAVSEYLVVADIDGKRKDARIRQAAALRPEDVIARFGHAVEDQTRLEWDGVRLVEIRRRRIGGIVLDEQRGRPKPGDATFEALAARLAAEPDLLEWPDSATVLRRRVAFARSVEGNRWPTWTDLELRPVLEDAIRDAAATSLDEIGGERLTASLKRLLGHGLLDELDRAAPVQLALGNGRAVPVDYGGDVPTVSAPVQRFFGVEATPNVSGVPVLVELLSPARRPVQVTRDLGGFWTGSWQAVRKEMAGRYPKHGWPERPTAADSR